MSRFPDFTDTTLFPTFASLPLSTDDVPSSSPYPPPFVYYLSSRLPQILFPLTKYRAYILLGTISENMTLSTSPTFICKDPSGTPFALTMRIPSHLVKEGVRGGGYDVSRFKKGFTVVVREGLGGERVRRSGVSEGKQGFVEVGIEGVLVCNAFMMKVTG